jgi:hypothetical protein
MNRSLFIRPIALALLTLNMAMELKVEGQDDQGYVTSPPQYSQPQTPPQNTQQQNDLPSPFVTPQTLPSPFTQPPVIKDFPANTNGSVQQPPSQPLEQYQLPDRAAERENALKTVIQSQLTDIRELDYSKAYYAYMSADFQKAFSMEVFRAFVLKSPTFFRNKTFTVENVSFRDVIATVKGKLTSSDGQAARVQYDLIQEDGVWKIRNINLTLIAPVPSQNKKLSRPLPPPG